MKKKICLFEKHLDSIKTNNNTSTYLPLSPQNMNGNNFSKFATTTKSTVNKRNTFSPNQSSSKPTTTIQGKTNLTGSLYTSPIKSITHQVSSVKKSVEQGSKVNFSINLVDESLNLSTSINKTFNNTTKNNNNLNKTLQNNKYSNSPNKEIDKTKALLLSPVNYKVRQVESNIASMIESNNKKGAEINNNSKIIHQKSKSFSLPKNGIPKKVNKGQSLSYQAQIDLLFKKNNNKNNNKQETLPEVKESDNSKQRMSLMSKISKAVGKNINVFTKVNLFEEVETEEFDNPKFREYMQDRVLCEYLTPSQTKFNNNVEIVQASLLSDNEIEDSLRDQCDLIGSKFENKKERKKNYNGSDGQLQVIKEGRDIDNLADSVIESTMYGNSTNKNNGTNYFSPLKKQSSFKKRNSVAGKINNSNSFSNNKDINIKEATPSSFNMTNKLTLFGIFDGHGGDSVSIKAREILPKEIHQRINQSSSDLIIKSLITESFEKTDKELMTKLTNCDDVGSTCTLCFIMKYKTNRIVYVSNIGDSHCYIVSNKKATRLTAEHKCDNEEEVARLKEKNALIFQNRMFGQLALTRAFCDRKLKPYGLSASPNITTCIVKERQISATLIDSMNDSEETEYDIFIVLASDGIWDVTKESDLMRIFVEEGKHKSTKVLTKEILDFSIKNGSTDNISVIVIRL